MTGNSLSVYWAGQFAFGWLGAYYAEMTAKNVTVREAQSDYCQHFAQ